MSTTVKTPLRPEDAPASIYGPDGRPQIFQDPAMDRFVAVLLNVSSELWVQTEKLANIEALITQKGVITAEDLKSFANDPVIAAERHKAAHVFIEQLLSPLREPQS